MEPVFLIQYNIDRLLYKVMASVAYHCVTVQQEPWTGHYRADIER